MAKSVLEKDWVTIEKAAEMIATEYGDPRGFSPRSIRRMIQSGDLQFGSDWRQGKSKKMVCLDSLRKLVLGIQ